MLVLVLDLIGKAKSSDFTPELKDVNSSLVKTSHTVSTGVGDALRALISLLYFVVSTLSRRKSRDSLPRLYI